MPAVILLIFRNHIDENTYKEGEETDMKKKIFEAALFFGIMFLTFYTLLHGQNMSEIFKAVKNMSVPYLAAAAGLALFFVCAEGSMIWYLLRSMGQEKSSLPRCIQYSFIGFFYSGITPSATGGQPVQLYYMNKDGNKGSDCTVVLMTVAVIYKFVLVALGAVLLAVLRGTLKEELHSYFPLYLVGMLLNTIVVLVVLAAMLFPKWMLFVAAAFEKQMLRLDIWKEDKRRMEKVKEFTDSYQKAVSWMKQHKGKLGVVLFVTFLQRCSVFLLTYMVYLGFGESKTPMLTVLILQASVYIAVDMLPLPGAQGITELMYRTVFATVFSGNYLIPSMLVSRGLNFYFLLLVSLFVVVINKLCSYRSCSI